VEAHQQLIRQQLDEFFRQQVCPHIDEFILAVITGQAQLDHQSLLERVLHAPSLMMLLNNLKQNIQVELNRLYKISSTKLANFYPQVEQFDLDNVLDIAEETLNSLMVAKSAFRVSNQVWKKCSDAYHFSPLLSKFLQKMELGSVYMTIVGCHPNAECMRAQKQLLSQLRGFIRLFQQKVSREFCLTIAQIIYEVHEQARGQRCVEEVKMVESKQKQKKILCLEKRAG
jgi:hypothetical protein